MMQISDEAIVLKSFSYKESERIATLYSKEHGLIQLIFKKVSIKEGNTLLLSSLFTQGEYHFLKGRSEIYRFREGSLLHPFLELRERLDYLHTAGCFAKAILASQLPGKPSSDLYHLLLAYLKRIPQSTSLSNLRTSFYVKLLKHEGLISPLEESHEEALSPEDWQSVQRLYEIKNFQELEELSLDIELESKVEKWLSLALH